MSIKCLPELEKENVSTTGFTHRWVLDIMNKYDPEFKKAVGYGVVTKVRSFCFIF